MNVKSGDLLADRLTLCCSLSCRTLFAMVFWLAALAACKAPPTQDSLAVLQPFAVPQRFSRWWELVESCSARSGDMAAIRWFVVPGAFDFTVSGQKFQGYTFDDPPSIVLAERAALDGQLVRHEMLHALGVRGHPAEQFRERCGGIVACSGQCARDVGEPYAPTASADSVTADALDVNLMVWPSETSVSADSGWTTLVITARNPRATPVLVHLRPIAPGGHAAVTFGFYEALPDQQVDAGSANYAFQDEERFAFRAGETRRFSFDRQYWSDGVRVRAFFNTQLAPDAAINVIP